MAKRFEYRRMDAGEFRADLQGIGMGYLAFSRIFGQDERRVRKWMAGQEDIPVWIPVVLEILKTTPGAIAAARLAAGDFITQDNEHPERGEYPFRRYDED